mmetsp:Transcript_2612/g.3789  ORF Transcript_2612/g.3789 Transcript_2612/m.3789 type:complete len:255 (-) Transcript_2612:236-1000(-)
MGMAGAYQDQKPDERPDRAPVPMFNKQSANAPNGPNTSVSNSQSKPPTASKETPENDDIAPPPGFSGENSAPQGDARPPPGFCRREEEAGDGDGNNDADAGGDNGHDAPPPGYEQAPFGFEDQKGLHGDSNDSGESDNISAARKRQRNPEQHNSSAMPNVPRAAKTPKVTLREVSERDWARVDSILDLAFSRVKPDQPSSRAAMKKSLVTNPLIRAISSDQTLAARYNKMVEETIDFEGSLQPYRSLLMEAAKL